MLVISAYLLGEEKSFQLSFGRGLFVGGLFLSGVLRYLEASQIGLLQKNQYHYST